jgi:membrane-bound ClpP family serine protease
LFALIFARSLKKGFLYKSSIVLKHTEEKSDGFVSNSDYSRLIGKTGRSATILRPAGIAVFDGEKVDVVTDGEFIQPNVSVEVYEVAGRRVIVRRAEHVNNDKTAGFDTTGNSLDI